MPQKLITICAIVVIACPAFCAPEKATSNADKQGVESLTKETGPTVYIDYEGRKNRDNSVASFMYFVPMISKVPVESESSPDNAQKVQIVSCERESDSDSFEIECEFVMWGDGYHINKFDLRDIIAQDTDNMPKDKHLKDIIEYIKFQGEGRGKIEISGEKTNGVVKVTDVRVIFNHGGNVSPVTIGLYNIKPNGDKYKFDNRYSAKKARVSSISFSADDPENPYINIKLDSLGARNTQVGFFSKVKGEIANLFIPPLNVTPEGNQAMLDFGYALYAKQTTFTFPKAENIKPNSQEIQEPVLAKADDTDETRNTKAN